MIVIINTDNPDRGHNHNRNRDQNRPCMCAQASKRLSTRRQQPTVRRAAAPPRSARDREKMRTREATADLRLTFWDGCIFGEIHTWINTYPLARFSESLARFSPAAPPRPASARLERARPPLCIHQIFYDTLLYHGALGSNARRRRAGAWPALYYDGADWAALLAALRLAPALLRARVNYII